jgi:predicted helicase
MSPNQIPSTPRTHREDSNKKSKSTVKRSQSSDKHPPPSKISRNYSGTSAYYTPKELVQYLLRGINFLLQMHWGESKHLLSKDNLFLDPAAGMAAFPLELLKYAHTHQNSSIFQQWVTESFVTSVFMFEIDNKICKQAVELINRTLQNSAPPNYSLFPQDHGMCRNPLLSSEGFTPIQSAMNPDSSFSEPCLVIFGNPPYSISSSPTSPWMQTLMEDYKRTLNRPGKKPIVGLKGIQDDYVKFVRWSQWALHDQKHPGILAFVVNNYFLDGDIFRGMRESLRNVFDEIRIINLFGDPKKSGQNSSPTSSTTKNEKDENLFDIQTGVCLFLGVVKKVKTPSSRSSGSPKCKVYYAEIRGSKTTKWQFLAQEFSEIPFTPVPPRIDFEFIPQDPAITALEKKYNAFPYLPDVFQQHIIGVQSLHDSLVTHPDRARLEDILTKFYDGTYARQAFTDQKGQSWVKTEGVVYHDARDWKIVDGLQGSREHALSHIIPWQWRGFDRWWVCYDEHLMTKGSSSYRLMQFLLPPNKNLAIGVARVSRKASGENSVFLTDTIAESHCLEGGSGIGDYFFPLRIDPLAPKKSHWETVIPTTTYNFQDTFLHTLQLFYPNSPRIDPETLFFYIYGVLWTPGYRQCYAPFLKKDFPHVPFPNSINGFHKIAVLGKELGQCHLLQAPEKILTAWPTQLSESSDNITLKITAPTYDAPHHRIYFQKPSGSAGFWVGDITPRMWAFDLGGHPQLALWLKHRTLSPTPTPVESHKRYKFHRAITPEELQVFLKICWAISKTVRIQAELTAIYDKLQFHPF